MGIRAFAPLILGNRADSNIPAALFDIEIRNCRAGAVDLELIIEPPNATGSPTYERGPHEIALVGEDITVVKHGDELTGRIARTIEGHGSSRVRFVFGWHSPYWRDSGREPHYTQYSLRNERAAAAAKDALKRFESLLAGVLDWQSAIYAADLPNWLPDGLVQSLYSLSKNTVWIARTRNDAWWDDIGWFTYNESHTSCPITETMVCRMHGHLPILFFFPEPEQTALEAFKHFQISLGEIPFRLWHGKRHARPALSLPASAEPRPICPDDLSPLPAQRGSRTTDALLRLGQMRDSLSITVSP